MWPLLCILIAGVSSFTRSVSPTTARLACLGIRAEFKGAPPRALFEKDAWDLRSISSRQLSSSSLKSSPSPDDESEEAAGSATPPSSVQKSPPVEGGVSTGGGGDWFQYVLLAYLVFAVLDTAFHILPNKSYVQMAIDAFGGASSATSAGE